MKDADLIQALKRMGVQTGGLICLGCGHEAGCGVHGCAVIREAAQRLEEYHQGKEHIDRETWEKPKCYKAYGRNCCLGESTRIGTIAARCLRCKWLERGLKDE